ncbi:MAG TPA: branched-chain amino acid aminotransferase [Alphaproteobacteria bacterium]|nr:branched-chain amino acid aminotransferase [Alphaproteobacteria bacterium]
MMAAPFDDRDGLIWLDGKQVDWRDAKIHVLSHGLHYASVVFEGERAYSGKIFKLREHTERLFKSAELLGMTIPYSVDEINKASEEMVKASGFANAYVRPVAWRGTEMMAVSAQATKIHVSIAVWEWPSYFTPEARLRGLRLTRALYKRPSPETEPVHAKASGLYMICTLSKHAAEAKGYDDALMLDYRGQLAESTGANIFLVQNGEIHTPTPDCFLNGITRQTVIDLARKRGIKVTERAIFPEELAKSQEMFLTGTAAEVTPVSEVDEYKFTVGPVTRALMQDYDALVNGKAPVSA